MKKSSKTISSYLETGSRRTFAGAIEWPGWCVSGRDEHSALEALVSYGPRYIKVMSAVKIELEPPSNLSEIEVCERLQGNSTTDYGTPAIAPAADERSIEKLDFDRLEAVLKACWLTFDEAIEAAGEKTLRKGPRGGGRDLPDIIEHVIEANNAYLSKLAWKPSLDVKASPSLQLNQTLDEALQALAASAAGDLPSQGPRGGRLWSPRYFARRVAWHVLDHAWEIEDRAD